MIREAMKNQQSIQQSIQQSVAKRSDPTTPAATISATIDGRPVAIHSLHIERLKDGSWNVDLRTVAKQSPQADASAEPSWNTARRGRRNRRSAALVAPPTVLVAPPTAVVEQAPSTVAPVPAEAVVPPVLAKVPSTVEAPRRRTPRADDAFDDWFCEGLCRGLAAAGFEQPSAVQRRSMPALLQGHSAVIQERSGMGKTAAFACAILQHLHGHGLARSFGQPRVAVLCHARHLVRQTTDAIAQLAASMEPRPAVAALGLGNLASDARLLGRQRVDVVVTTPARLAALGQSGAIQQRHLDMLVLDEADELVASQEAEERLYALDGFLGPATTQVVATTATLSPRAEQALQGLLGPWEPQWLVLAPDQRAHPALSHYRVQCPAGLSLASRADTAAQLLSTGAASAKAVVFASRKADVAGVAARLRMSLGHDRVSEWFGELPPAQQRAQLQAFRAGPSRVLVTTDALARGLDVTGVLLVVQLGLPRSPSCYVQRAGRAGRFGRRGVCVSLVEEGRDGRVLAALAEHHSTSLADLPADLSVLWR